MTPLPALSLMMKDDPDYAWAIHCNIAVPIMDSGVEWCQANYIAAKVMQHLFGVDTREHENFKSNKRLIS